MADISKIQISTGTYNVKDETARNDLASLTTRVNGIIESGTNANGSYIKFEDGTMITRQRFIDDEATTFVQFGSLWRVGLDGAKDFPVPFIEQPIISCTLMGTFGAWLMPGTSYPTPTNAWGGEGYQLVATEKKQFTNIEVDVIGIGKWK